MLECILSHNQAYTALSKHRDQVSLKTWTTYCDTINGQTITKHYLYSAPSAEAISSIKAYQKALGTLEERILINSAGDSFILGIIAALVNRTFTKEIVNKPALVGLSLALLATIIGQSYGSDPIPYFRYYSLERMGNILSCFDSYLIGRVGCMLLGTTAGYLGTSYIFSKFTNQQTETDSIYS